MNDELKYELISKEQELKKQKEELKIKIKEQLVVFSTTKAPNVDIEHRKMLNLIKEKKELKNLIKAIRLVLRNL
jgi:hypothetical protein